MKMARVFSAYRWPIFIGLLLAMPIVASAVIVWVATRPDAPRPIDGYYEVWLLKPDASGMVSVGILDSADQGLYPLPAGIPLEEFPVVDVSIEEFDGNAAHSAVSVVRGSLDA